MEIPAYLEQPIAQQSEQEYNNPSTDFGDRMRDFIEDETGEELCASTVDEFNTWFDLWVGREMTWADFVRWVWRKIVEWWNSLWD